MNKIWRKMERATKALHGEGVPPAVRAEIPSITPEEIQEAREFFPMPKFFIFGHARSGTTLLARLIRTHPEVHCNWQSHFFTRPPLLSSLVSNPETAEWLSRRSNRWNRGRDLSPVVMRAASDFILEREARKEGKSVVGDKSPNSILNGESVRLMHAIYPDARLLFIVRDGRDTAISHRFQSFIDTVESLSPEDLEIRRAYLQNPQPYIRRERSLFTRNGIRESAKSWVRNVCETDEAGKSLYGDRYLSLRYEDLLENVVELTLRVWEFLGVEGASPELEAAIRGELESNPDAEWQSQKESDLSAGLRKGVAGSWRDYFTSEDRQIFKEVAGETLIAWDYEKDLRW
jgi:hypothetical protein